MHQEKRGVAALPRDLGNGLVLRRATAADTEALASFNAAVHDEPDEPEVGIDIWTRDMMRGDHPTTGAGDFLLVEDTGVGAIASSLCLIAQTWAYAGIPFGVGMPELVGTAPEYRRRGLVRAMFDAVHAMSAARGQMVQVVGGIPWYYRQFGYEMALEWETGRYGSRLDVPDLAAGAPEPYRVRPATNTDIPIIARAYEHGMARGRVSCLRDAAQWRYDIAGHSPGSDYRLELRVIETAAGEPAGFLAHPARLWKTGIYATACELLPGVSWLAVMPSVLRYLRAVGDDYATTEKRPFTTVHFEVGAEHPVCRVAPSVLRGLDRTYALYVRVPDLAGFLGHIAPALEQRLAGSILAGHTGDLALNFYRTGLRLTFAAGRLAGIAPWQPETDARGDAAFPDLTFLQLLFGYRSLDELAHAFPDCILRNDAARVLLDTLFPKQASTIWPVA